MKVLSMVNYLPNNKKHFLTKVVFPLFYDMANWILAEFNNFVFFYFRLIFQRTATWLRHSNLQHLQLPGTVCVSGTISWKPLHTRFEIFTVEMVFWVVTSCGWLWTFGRNSNIHPRQPVVSIFSIEEPLLLWTCSSKTLVTTLKTT